MEELQASTQDRVHERWCRLSGEENCRLSRGAQFTSHRLHQVYLLLFYPEAEHTFSPAQRLIIPCRKKAGALLLRQDEVISSLNVYASKSITALLETRTLIREDLLNHRDHIFRKTTENASSTQSSTLLAISEAQSIEVEMVQSLHFTMIDDRHDAIPEAHRQTFRWIFDENRKEGCPWSNFAEWLRTGSGLYWINGKAGSGKSTLMRYIFNNAKTRQQLNYWAGESSLDISGFFFWNSGSPIQRSQAGLLKSLLFQALQQQPNLVRVVFPEEWAMYSSSTVNHTRIRNHHYSLSTLQKAFKRWIDLLPSSSKVCFFIDGLDEYDGDHEEIAEFFKGLSSRTSNVKLCVSSRPWVVFDDAFKGIPMLRLQDLTFDDIQAYVFDKLEGHDRMRLLKNAEPGHAAGLVNEVVTKASGVFLWVTLVVKSLLNGLRNRDCIGDLRRRLSELPSDLDKFYTHMLNHVDPLYREQAARTFRIFETLVGFSHWNVYALEFELALKGTFQNTQLDEGGGPMGWVEVSSRIRQLDIHLKSRCDGLLELHHFDHASVISNCYSTVHFMHRTVKDFLDTPRARAWISAAITSPDFDPNLSIATSHVIMIKRDIFGGNGDQGIQIMPPYDNANVCASISTTMGYAREVEDADKLNYSSVIDELSRVGMQKWRMDEGPLSANVVSNGVLMHTGESWMTCDKPRKWKRDFIGLAIRHGLLSYVEREVREDRSLVLEQRETPLLLETLICGNNDQLKPWSPQMADILLRHGANPNQLWRGNSPWQHALTNAHEQYSSHDALLLTTMLTYGASVFTTCTLNHQIGRLSRSTRGHASHTVEDVIENVIEHAIEDEIENYSRVPSPSESSELQRVLRYQKSLQQPRPDPIEFKCDVERRTKRSCDEIETYESRKRWRR